MTKEPSSTCKIQRKGKLRGLAKNIAMCCNNCNSTLSASSNTKRNLKSTGGEAKWVRSSRSLQKLKLLQRTSSLWRYIKTTNIRLFTVNENSLAAAMGGRTFASIYFFTGDSAIFVAKLWIYFRLKRTSASQCWLIFTLVNTTLLFWIFFKRWIPTTESRSRKSPSSSQTRVWN